MIPIFKHDARRRYARAVARQMMRGSIGPGERVEQFERMLCEVCKVEHAVVVNSGTSALLLALWPHVDHHGVDVLLPDYTNHAAGHAATMLGLFERPVDVHLVTACMDPAFVPKGDDPCVFVHHNRYCLDVGAVAEKRGTNRNMIEDRCQAFCCEPVRGCACLSFAPMKLITTGQGGAILTNDDRFADEMRILRGGGRHDGPVGGNFRMTDIQAAYGIAQLERLDEIVEQRDRVHRWYRDGGVPVVPGTWCVTTRVSHGADLVAYLEGRGVEAAQFYKPRVGLPNAKIVARETVYLPSHPTLTRREVATVCRAVREYEGVGG